VFLVYSVSYAAPFTLLEKFEVCCESDNWDGRDLAQVSPVGA
jgi:hypothetical protein